MNIAELSLLDRTEEETSNGDTIITTYYKCPCQDGKVIEIYKNGTRSIVIDCDICRDSFKDEDIC